MTAAERARVEVAAVYAQVRAGGGAVPPEMGGQLIRPQLALAGAGVLGAAGDARLWRAAAAVQLAHEASLVHDDVIDGATERRGRATVVAARGVAAALVEGDHLLTTSYRLAAAAGPAFLRAFTRAVERTVAGEKLQGRAAGAVLTMTSYRRIVAFKSGELLGCALAAAPLLCGRPAGRWYAFGRRIGTLYQMLDDLLDYCPGAGTGKPALGDFRQRRWTWPLGLLAQVSFDDDADHVLARLHEPDEAGVAPLHRGLAGLLGEADALAAAAARLLPGDGIVAALLAEWGAAATAAVAPSRPVALAAVDCPHGAAPASRPRGVPAETGRSPETIAAAPAQLPEVADLGGYFARNSRTFSFAARLLPADFRAQVTRVYALCRATDDMADGGGAGAPARLRQLDAWERLARSAWAGTPTDVPLLDSAAADARAAHVPFVYFAELIEGMRMDVRGTRYGSLAELRVYSQRVAGVIGQWLTRLAGVHDEVVLERAAALGHALQLTNIIRDVGEDLALGRVYLPAEALARFDITEADLHALAAGAPIPAAYRALLEHLMDAADRDYAAALGATSALPPYFRRAVEVAAHVYRGIHDEVRRNRYDNLTRRARTRVWTKARLALRALAQSRPVQPHAPLPPRWQRAALLPVLALCLAGIAAPARAQQMTPREHVARAEARLAATPHDELRRLDLVRALFFTAVADERDVPRGAALVRDLRGDTARIREAGTDLERAGTVPAALLLAYDGAFRALQAKHGTLPWSRLRAVREGLARMDSAVARAPDHAEVRYLRLVNTHYLPGLFGRRESAREDMRVLTALLLLAPAAAPPPLYRVMTEFVLAEGRPSADEAHALRALLASLEPLTDARPAR